jgi:hypothetical protein
LQGAELVLKHAVAGEKPLAGDAWLWVRRHSPSLIHLADTAAPSTRTFPLIRSTPELPRVEYVQAARSDDSPPFTRRIRIWPKTIVSYQPGAGEFHATLSLDPRSRGAAVVRFRAGGNVLAEHVLAPADKTPVSVGFPVAADTGFSVEVDFDKAILFPCGVLIDDPFVALGK